MAVRYICPDCGAIIVHGERSQPICKKCPGEPPPPPPWTIAIRRLAKPTDRGIGDTVQRIASWFGGEAFKRFATKLGIPCGCTQRQDEWNQRWPY